MKFKWKFSDAILLLLTFVAIIFSMFLWIFILTGEQRFSQSNQANSTLNEQIKSRSSKSLYDLYMPTNAYSYKDGRMYRLYDFKNNLSFEFTRELRKLVLTEIKEISSGQTDYEELLKNENYLQLTYPDQIPFGLISNLNSVNKNKQFNRIFIPQNSNKFIYVGNDKKYIIYKVYLKNANFDQLRKYAQNAQYRYQVNLVRLKVGYSAFYVNRQKWRIYSYLTNHQSDSYFVGRLLGTSGVTSRTNKKGITTYSLNYYTRLKVPTAKKNDYGYTYTHFGKNQYANMTDRLLDSVYYVHLIGLTELDLRFFDADDANISYTNYVEGMPVFLNKDHTQISTNVLKDTIMVDFNSTNLQIPIPFDGQTISLEPTQKVVDKLVSHGLAQSQIQRIVVGSKLEKDKSKDNLVNLVPTYYVKAYNQWKSADEWLKENLTSNDGQVAVEGGEN